MQHKSRDTVNCHMYDSYVQDIMHLSVPQPYNFRGGELIMSNVV